MFKTRKMLILYTKKHQSVQFIQLNETEYKIWIQNNIINICTILPGKVF